MADDTIILEGRARDLGGGVTVRRVLPAHARRMVGPFIFFDHFGPVQLPPGQGLDVRPHPHIDLATVTYLFEGEILHRDSLGSVESIRPGAINWMTAGRGIVHSERSPAAARAAGARLHGLQLWVGLPLAHEQSEPSFHHQEAATIPTRELPGARLRVLAGAAYGARSPVPVLSALFYVEALLEAGAELALPEGYAERAAYVVEGAIDCDGTTHGAARMVVLGARASGRITALEPARIMLLGGEPLEGERHIWWNFASSSPARIEQAKEDWRLGRFAKVPGDEIEFIPLP